MAENDKYTMYKRQEEKEEEEKQLKKKKKEAKEIEFKSRIENEFKVGEIKIETPPPKIEFKAGEAKAEKKKDTEVSITTNLQIKDIVIDEQQGTLSKDYSVKDDWHFKYQDQIEIEEKKRKEEIEQYKERKEKEEKQKEKTENIEEKKEKEKIISEKEKIQEMKNKFEQKQEEEKKKIINKAEEAGKEDSKDKEKNKRKELEEKIKEKEKERKEIDIKRINEKNKEKKEELKVKKEKVQKEVLDLQKILLGPAFKEENKGGSIKGMFDGLIKSILGEKQKLPQKKIKEYGKKQKDKPPEKPKGN